MKLSNLILPLLLAFSCNQIEFKNGEGQKDNIVDGGSTSFSCPSGYAKVDSSLCVMTSEARQGSDNRPESRLDIVAWHTVTPQEAIDACDTLNTPAHPHGQYALINNDEWIKIANQIEVIGDNWSSGIAYNGCLKRGTASGWDSEVCVNTGSSTPVWGGARTSTIGNLKIASGETIYDFSGNYFEVIDAEVTQWNKPYAWNATYPDWVPVQSELFEVDTHVGPTFPFSLSTIGPLNTSLRVSDGVGAFSTKADPGYTDPAVYRGGVSWGPAGIYDLYLSRAVTQKDPDVSFRCVFRKNP